MTFHTQARVGKTALALAIVIGAGLPGLAANAEVAAVTAEACTTCHGPGGVSEGEMPTIAGQDAATLTEALRGYRDGTLQGTIMGKLVTTLSDEEIAALAEYFAALPGAGQ